MSVYLDIKSLYPHLKVNWNVLMCKICIARRLVVDIFPWCNANFVPFPSGTLVAHRIRNGSIRVKALFEPIVLRKKATGFALFKSIILRNRSLSNARWFYGKKRQIRKGNLYQLGRNEIWYAKDNHSYMCHICAKGILDSNFNYNVIGKISIFHEIALNFTYSQ